jgi:Flp pilus assembly protein TadD
MGRREEAFINFEKALALQPDNPGLLNNLAWIMVRLGHKLERAETLARRATKLEPGSASYWDTLGLVQQARGQSAAAVASYHQALKLDPDLASAKANLLKILLSMDQSTLARELGTPGPTPAKPAPPAKEARPGQRP